MLFTHLLMVAPQRPLERIDEILVFVSLQVSASLEVFGDYAARRETVAEHQERIRRYLKLRRYSAELEVAQFVFEEALRLEQASALLARTKEYLRLQQILIPGDATLHRLIKTQREAATTYIYTRISGELTGELKQILDELLVSESSSRSGLQTLKQPPRRASPTGLLELTGKLEKIAKTGILGIDLGWLNNNFQRSLARYVRRCSAKRLRELSANRRHTALVCYLQQIHRDTIDEMVNSFDKLMSRTWSRAEENQAQHAKAGRKQVRASLAQYRSILELLLDEAIKDAELRGVVFDRFGEEELEQEVVEVETMLSGKFSHVFKLIVNRHRYFRQFSPALLQHLQLRWETGSSSDLLEALEVLRLLNEQSRRKLPSEVPAGFIPKRLRPLVFSEGTASKPAWECALLLAVRDEIKQGNLSVVGSKRFGRLDDFFIPEASWHTQRDAFFARAGLPSRAEEVGVFLTQRLNRGFDGFLGCQPENNFAQIDETGWKLSSDVASRLDQEAEGRLKTLKNYLSSKMRVVKLPELLIEVDNELHITRRFMTAAQQEHPKIKHVRDVLVHRLISSSPKNGKI